MSDNIIEDIRRVMAEMGTVNRLEGFSWDVLSEDKALTFDSEQVTYILAHPKFWKRAIAKADGPSHPTCFGIFAMDMFISDWDTLTHEAQMVIVKALSSAIGGDAVL